MRPQGGPGRAPRMEQLLPFPTRYHATAHGLSSGFIACGVLEGRGSGSLSLLFVSVSLILYCERTALMHGNGQTA
eukprot:1161212-Pelagomonas_calceolata.AAC.14